MPLFHVAEVRHRKSGTVGDLVSHLSVGLNRRHGSEGPRKLFFRKGFNNPLCLACCLNSESPVEYLSVTCALWTLDVYVSPIAKSQAQSFELTERHFRIIASEEVAEQTQQRRLSETVLSENNRDSVPDKERYVIVKDTEKSGHVDLSQLRSDRLSYLRQDSSFREQKYMAWRNCLLSNDRVRLSGAVEIERSPPCIVPLR
jgi:hypothetical protein